MDLKPCSYCGKPTSGETDGKPICMACYVGPKRVALWRELRLAGKTVEPDGTPIQLSDAELFAVGDQTGWQIQWSDTPLPTPVAGDMILTRWQDDPRASRPVFEMLEAAVDGTGKTRWIGLISGISFNLQKSGFKENAIQAWAWIRKGI